MRLMVPGAVKGDEVPMAFRRKPQYDQAVKQHRHRRGALDGAATPSLRLLKAQMLLAVVERDFNRPSHGVPSQHFDGGGLEARRIKRLRPPVSGSTATTRKGISGAAYTRATRLARRTLS